MKLQKKYILWERIVFFWKIYCFFECKFKAKKVSNYLRNAKKFIVSEKNVMKFYREIRKVIYQYYIIEYNKEILGVENQMIYSCDESLFSQDLVLEQLWVLGLLTM